MRRLLDSVLDGVSVTLTTAAPIIAILGIYKLLELLS